MQRLLIQELVKWKQQRKRKPLLLDGARQVGKSYLIEHIFGKNHFSQIHKLDFLADPSLKEIFEESLDPRDILTSIEIQFNVSIDIETDLIFFDEIGESTGALNALKYFAEELPEIYVCASGSNIGLLDSFPVGKVQLFELFPLCFEEFLMAIGNEKLLEAFRAKSRQKVVHDALWKVLLDYYFVGGMPEAVKAWFEEGVGVRQRCEDVSRIHRDLIRGYSRDFGKYSGKVDATHIESVFLNVPKQLSANMDESVKRFAFKDVVPKKNRYLFLRGPIDWLEKSKLVSKCYPIESEPKPPLASLTKENRFKLFVFDIGLLGHMLEMTYSDQLAQKVEYKGFIAENFVQNELRCRVSYPTYSWQEARGEIEFLHRDKEGNVLPVEVKSSSKTRARSLRSYVDRYHPAKTIKLIGGAGGYDHDATNLVWPLYYTQFLNEL